MIALRVIAIGLFAFLVPGCMANPMAHMDNVTVTSGSVGFHYVRGARTPFGFIYETGSQKGGVPFRSVDFDEQRPLITAVSDGVEVRVFGAATHLEATTRLAQAMADGLNSVRSNVWAQDTAHRVTVSLLIRGEGLPDSISQRQRFDEDEGWKLAFAINPILASETRFHSEPIDSVAHELYHLMVRYRRPHPDRLPGRLGSTYEEVTASLYGRCAVILAGLETTLLAEPFFEVGFDTDEGRVGVYAPLPDFWLNRLINELDAEQLENRRVRYILHVPLRLNAFNEVSEGRPEIVPGSTQAERLLSLCREHAPHPTGIRAWLKDIAGDGRFVEPTYPYEGLDSPANASTTAS